MDAPPGRRETTATAARADGRVKIVLYNPRAVFFQMPLALLAIGSQLDPDEFEVVTIDGRLEADPTADGPADLDIAVIRLTADGSLDESFGDGGIARIDLGPGKRNGDALVTDNAWGLTARDGGYAVMAVTPNQGEGRTDTDYAIVGLTEDGELDESFGDDGVVVVDLGRTNDSARHIGVQEDGKILATGYSNAGGVVSNGDGSHDRSSDSAVRFGRLLDDPRDRFEVPQAHHLQGGGKAITRRVQPAQARIGPPLPDRGKLRIQRRL